MLTRFTLLMPLLLLGACGGGDTTDSAAPNDVGAKAIADVDAAMAETLRAERPPATTIAPAR